MARIYSYVVRYDSGFAPNPFYGVCTLATCKPDIRRTASVGDWVIGSGSNDRTVRRGGYLVYAMRVSETKTFSEYNVDTRFRGKKPYRFGSRKQSCGDNIYYRDAVTGLWRQRDSFHTKPNGDLNPLHVARDTGVDRVLISNHFVYFGGEGPKIPSDLEDEEGRSICKKGIGRTVFHDDLLTGRLETWLSGLGVAGYQGPPFEWISLRD